MTIPTDENLPPASPAPKSTKPKFDWSKVWQHFPQLFGGMVSLSIALVGGAYLGSTAIRSLKTSDSLTVIGSATKPIRSDYAVWRSSVSSQQVNLSQSYQELKRHTDRIKAYLINKSIPENAISLSAIETQPVPEVNANGAQTGKVISYRLVQRFEVRSADVDLITKISRSSTEVINEGVPFVSEAPEYLYTELSKLRVEMIADATRDAKARAEAILQVTGNRVGAIRRAETDVFQITARNSTETSNSGSYNTTSIDKDIRAVVSISFSVD
jgi:hypothetical protein